MKPEQCPRCHRSSDTWSLEKASEYLTRGGCECGEVIEFVSDDVDLSPLAPTSRKPAGWREDERLDRWSATVGSISRGLVIAAVLGAAFMALRLTLVELSRRQPHLWIAALLPLLLITTVILRWGRRWKLSIADGVFRAEALAQRYELPLAEIQDVTFFRSKNERGALVARSLVVLRKTGPILQIPLVVEPEEAQFVLDRLRAKLATDGRSVDHGYRGEQVRIGTDDTAALAQAEAEAEDAAQETEARRTRR